MHGRDFDGVIFEQAVMEADVELGEVVTEEKEYIKDKVRTRR